MSYSSVDQLKSRCWNGSNLMKNTNCKEANSVAEVIALKSGSLKFLASYQKLGAIR